ncbi:hypothetical protein B0F87_102576 [Methylobacter tundripaludum]|uniref:Uncharacterized protein n=1 Tax=Methylobacter tundripaludum TaxID=173365 RepID=A0A2S6HJA5_9GAMM|nr:hypothetical protein [Methylobacter tundripaludum]PPK77461.1 hypothetical protein B0F87_102576 [Methylobacter tundripaludum]
MAYFIGIVIALAVSLSATFSDSTKIVPSTQPYWSSLPRTMSCLRLWTDL